MWGSEDNLAKGEEGNFEKGKQMVWGRRYRRINKTRVLFKRNQETFFLFSGETLADLKFDFRIVVEIQVGNIQRNEERHQ